jgi:hypothetical protein
MGSNYVKISTEEYNRLRDFKIAIDNGLTVEVDRYDDLGSGYVYSKDEFSKSMLKDLDLCKKELAKARLELNLAFNPPAKGITIKDIQKMSLWGFWKWKWL